MFLHFSRVQQTAQGRARRAFVLHVFNHFFQNNHLITMSNTTDNAQAMPKASAIEQFASTFGSLDELLELFDNLLNRINSAYSGASQYSHDLVGDYDFVHQLKQAIKADLMGIDLKFTPDPYYSNTLPFAHIRRLTNVAQVAKVAQTKGFEDFRAVKLNKGYVLLTNWSKGEAKAYATTMGALEGSFSEEGIYMLRFLKLMEND